jgi:hypothetical protein
MDGGRVGEDQAVEFAALVGDLAAVEIDRDLSWFGIDPGDEAEIAVIDLRLQIDVQRTRAKAALFIGQRICMSRMGSRPKRFGMPSRTSSMITSSARLGSFASTK